MLHDTTIKMCNCANCNMELLGLEMRGYLRQGRIQEKYIREIVAGRVNGRPYCMLCLPLAEAERQSHGQPRSIFSF